MGILSQFSACRPMAVTNSKHRFPTSDLCGETEAHLGEAETTQIAATGSVVLLKVPGCRLTY